MLELYPRVKTGATSLAEPSKKDRTWILLTALKYDQPLTLYAADVDVISGEDGNISDSSEITSSATSSRTLIVDTKDHWTWQSTIFLITKSY